MIALALLLACQSPSEGERRKKDFTVRGTDTGLSTPSTGTPGGTTTPTTPEFDCDAIPQPPFDITSYGIKTQEDFDFSLDGYMVYQSGIAVVGTNKQAQETVLSAGAQGDPRGVHGLADGRIAIMSPWDGAIKISDPSNGSFVVLAGGFDTPNGVDVGADDRIYFTTYGEVGWIESDGSNSQVIHSWGGGGGYATPNGTVLSEDEQRLTVAVPALAGGTDFVTLDRTGPDSWDNAQVLHHVAGFYSALDEDICGNLYTVEYNTGAVVRIYPNGTAEPIAQLQDEGIWGFSAMRFGPGHNDWERDHLYVSLRNTKVYDIDIGVPGRTHPTTPVP